MRVLSYVTILWLLSSMHLQAQICDTNQSLITIEIITDSWGYETSWQLIDYEQNIILSVEEDEYANHTTYYHEICVESNTCTTFSLLDSFGDGGPSYSITIDSVEVIYAESENFGESIIRQFNCPPGSGCSSPISIDEGDYVAPHADTWYSFQPGLVHSEKTPYQRRGERNGRADYSLPDKRYRLAYLHLWPNHH